MTGWSVSPYPLQQEKREKFTREKIWELTFTWYQMNTIKIVSTTVEPPNKRYFEAKSFVPCREVVPISEVK